MIRVETGITGLIEFKPKVFGDERGFFFESWNKKHFNNLVGEDVSFVQDNHSKSNSGTLRGLHIQTKNTQAKLVRVIKGSVYDVAVDLRVGSNTYGKWYGTILTAAKKNQLWIPKGFAHGFLSLEDGTEFLYKCDNYYDPANEVSLSWSDTALDIKWPLDLITNELNLSLKDKNGISLQELELQLNRNSL